MNPNQPTSRRQFLQTSIALPAALTAMGGAATSAFAAEAETPASADVPAQAEAGPQRPRGHHPQSGGHDVRP